MIALLCLAHVALFVWSALAYRAKGLNKIRNLAVPVGIAFSYTSGVQAWQAAQNPGYLLKAEDIDAALWVSLTCYVAFLIVHRITPPVERQSTMADELIDPARMNWFALAFFVVGTAGYLLNMYIVGGVKAYLRLEEWSDDLFDVSGYVYMMKFVMYGAVGLWLCILALGRLSRTMHVLLVVVMTWLLFEALQVTDRGDTIRAGMLWVIWVYIAARTKKRPRTVAAWGYVVIGMLFLFMGSAVILLPAFRGTQRSLLTSEVTLSDAIKQAVENRGASRLSEKGGGEFDSAARIIKRVRIGEIQHPGPVHIARPLWNLVPRTLYPKKWEQFGRWAGKDWEEILIGSSSYYGCTITGWGEAYGCLGWAGAMGQFALMAFLTRKLETWLSRSTLGLMAACMCYLPLLNYVVMTFWAATMTLSVVVIPFLLVIRLCSKESTAEAVPAYRRRTRRTTA